jgi:hypothetical protein
LNKPQFIDEPAEAFDLEAGTLAAFVRPLAVEDITTEAVTRRLSYRLRQLIGPGRRFSLAEVAEATGIDPRTLQSYLQGVACPNLSKYYRLEHLLGPELGVEMARMLGWEPRFAEPQSIPANLIVRMKRMVDDTVEVIDEILERDEGPSHVRVLRPAARKAPSRRP